MLSESATPNVRPVNEARVKCVPAEQLHIVIDSAIDKLLASFGAAVAQLFDTDVKGRRFLADGVDVLTPWLMRRAVHRAAGMPVGMWPEEAYRTLHADDVGEARPLTRMLEERADERLRDIERLVVNVQSADPKHLSGDAGELARRFTLLAIERFVHVPAQD